MPSKTEHADSGIAVLIHRSRPAVCIAATLYALAALLLGMVHRMPAVVATDAGIATLLASGGVLPSGCSGAPEDPGKTAPGLAICDACLLVQCAAPPPPAIIVTPLALHGLVELGRVEPRNSRTQPQRTRPPSRAPPVLA